MTDDDAIEFLRQRFDAPLERVTLIGKRDFGAVRAAGFGDAPSKRALVGDTNDQAAFPAH